MYFSSWQAFWTMDGHGPYVWAAYLLSLTILVALVAMPLLRQRRFVRQQRQLLRQLAARSQRAEGDH